MKEHASQQPPAQSQLTHIIKRDGRKVPFEMAKIVHALLKASAATKEFDGKEAERLAQIVQDILKKVVGVRKTFGTVEQVQDTVEQVLMAAGHFQTAKAYILYRAEHTKIRNIETVIGVQNDLGLTVNQLKVIEKRFLLHNEHGKAVETPAEMFSRVARTLSQVEKKSQQQTFEKAFYEVMASLEFLPAGRTLNNAGTPQNQLASCFVLPIGDSMEGIFDSVKWTAMVHQRGGGCIAEGSKVFTSFCGLENFEVLYDRLGGKQKEKKEKSNGWAIDVVGKNIHTLALNPETGHFEKDRILKIWRYDLPADRIYSVEAMGQLKVTTSDWHPFFVFERNDIVEKRADEIEEGDLLVMGNPSLLDSWLFKKYQIVDGTVVDEEIGWLAGYILGDGSFGTAKANTKNKKTYKRLRLFDGTAESLEKAKKIFSRLSGEQYTIQQDRRSKTLCLSTTDEKIVSLFQQLTGILGPKDSSLSISSTLIKSPFSVVCSIIAGLLDSDGYVARDRSRISFDSESAELIDQISSLLNMIGIQTYVRSRKPSKRYWKMMYEAVVDGPMQLQLFDQYISPFLSISYKKERIVDCISSTINLTGVQSPLTFIDIQPFLEKLGIQTSSTTIHRKAVEISGESFWLHRFKEGKTITAALVVKLIDALCRSTVFTRKERDILEKWRLLHLSVRKVKRVTRGKKSGMFYDFTTQKFHNYLAGKHGMTVVHNTGFDFTVLRPRGDIVSKSSGGFATGPVSFMKVFDTATRQVMQGGKLRGANMGILAADHPDILEFITCKTEEGEISNFNISVGASDTFMKAVEKDVEFALRNPRNSQVVQTISARMLMDQIVSLAWRTGDPGMIYWDAINANNPLRESQGEIKATNPCISGNARISTSNGLISFEELHNQQKSGSQKTKVVYDSRVISEEGVKTSEISATYNQGEKEVYKLTTQNGFELVATKDHKIRTTDGWVHMEDLTSSHSVLLQSGEGVFPEEEKLSIQSSVKSYPTQWSKELGQILGWLVGDGWLRCGDKNCRVGWTFGKDDLAILPLFQSVLCEWYGKKIVSVERKETVQHLSFHGKEFISFFKMLGVDAKKAADKVVPSSIFVAPKESVIGFLQGLFTADGTVGLDKSKGSAYVRLTSKSKQLIQQTQLLLIQLGIVSKIYDRSRGERQGFPYTTINGEKKTYSLDGVLWELSITKENVRVFLEKIGFLGKKHYEKIQYILEMKQKKELFIDTVLTVEPFGKATVYDLTEPISHSFIADGIVVSNCGEQPLHPFDACNLGSINLSKFAIVDDQQGKGQQSKKKRKPEDCINWKRLEEVTHIAVRMLDNVITACSYPLPQIAETVKKNRRIGLGVMGWADLLLQLGVAYNSDEGVALAEKVMGCIQRASWEESERLAQEKGAFPRWKESWFARGYDPVTHTYKNKKSPRMFRNVAITTIAPTGTISMAAECSSGIEPVFALCYVKNVVESEGLTYVNKHFEHALKEAVGYNGVFHELIAEIAETGSAQHVDDVPMALKKVFVTAHDIDWQWHVKMQAAFQKRTDNAVSKTINMPADASLEEVRGAYLLAWKLGCKGITVYRDSSRSGQVLSVAADSAKKSSDDPKTKKKEVLIQSKMVAVPLAERKDFHALTKKNIEENIILQERRQTRNDETCPECGGAMQSTEGCSLCPSCGYSKCKL